MRIFSLQFSNLVERSSLASFFPAVAFVKIIEVYLRFLWHHHSVYGVGNHPIEEVKGPDIHVFYINPFIWALVIYIANSSENLSSVQIRFLDLIVKLNHFKIVGRDLFLGGVGLSLILHLLSFMAWSSFIDLRDRLLLSKALASV